jgi:hypothetical protein
MPARYSSKFAPPARTHLPRRQSSPVRPSPWYQTPTRSPPPAPPANTQSPAPKASRSKYFFASSRISQSNPAPINSQVRAAPNSTDQTAPATPPAQSDTNHRACQTRDTEFAPQSHTQNRATPAAPRLTPQPKFPNRRPTAEEYARTTQTAPATPHRASTPPRYPATQPAAPQPPAPETSSPATAQIETPAHHGHASRRTSPPDDTTRNVHRKKDIPQQALLIPREKHSTSTARARASRHAKSRHINRDHQSQRSIAITETPHPSRLPQFPKISKLV